MNLIKRTIEYRKKKYLYTNANQWKNKAVQLIYV